MRPLPEMPSLPEEPESWFQTFTFPIEDKAEAQARLVKLPLAGQPVAIKPRSWFERLFSWPWRPWHNSKVWTGTGEVDAFDIKADDEVVRFKVRGTGRLNVGTARITARSRGELRIAKRIKKDDAARGIFYD